jgi:hypothetical protein
MPPVSAAKTGFLMRPFFARLFGWQSTRVRPIERLRSLATPDPGVGADEPAGEADQDRREDRQPQALVAFQMSEVAVRRTLSAEILRFFADLRQPPDPAPA